MIETETRVSLRGSRDTSVEGRAGGGRRVWVAAWRRAAVGRAGCLAKVHTESSFKPPTPLFKRSTFPLRK
eukprot:scaffold85934_cov68-Phaeocystis_antarctica.AAC.1